MLEHDFPTAQPLATIGPSGRHDEFTTLDYLASLDESPEAKERSRSDNGNENVTHEGCYHLFFLHFPLPRQVSQLLLVNAVFK